MNKSDIQDSLWVYKYSPKKLSEITLPSDYKETMKNYIRRGIIPHLLFEGCPGSGKTSLAELLINLIDCESLRMNASDERGIDVVRGKIKNFARMASLNPLKIILLDEVCGMTHESFDALKTPLEKFSKTTRFILCCNYINKIPKEIRSRCQIFHFNAFPRYGMIEILKRILKQEKIEFKEDDLNKHIELCYPDLRKAINLMQQNIRSGKFQYIDDGELYKKIISFILKKDLIEIRKLLINNAIDYANLYRYVYDHIELFKKESRLKVLLEGAEYLYRNSTIADQEMNFSAFCIKVFNVV